MAKRISRTREEILANAEAKGLRIDRDNGIIWTTCRNCGGSGDYPSSMIPAGRCRFYCWKNRTEETFGKLPTKIDRYVRREQARDRKAHHQEKLSEARERAKRDALDGVETFPYRAFGKEEEEPHVVMERKYPFAPISIDEWRDLCDEEGFEATHNRYQFVPATRYKTLVARRAEEEAATRKKDRDAAQADIRSMERKLGLRDPHEALSTALAAAGYTVPDAVDMDSRDMEKEPWAVRVTLDIARRWAHKGRSLSEKQVALLEDMPAKIEEARERDRERAEERAASDHVGEVGERLDIVATCVFEKLLEKQWGTTHLLKFEDDDGNVFTWFSSSVREIWKGDRVTFRGTVKEHDTYKDQAQTVVTRCHVEEVEDGGERPEGF